MGTSFNFVCSEESGALLCLQSPGSTICVQSHLSIVRYMRMNIDNWLRLANKTLGLGLRDYQLYFVTGTTKTSAWALTAFENQAYCNKEGRIYCELGNLASVDIAIGVENDKFTSPRHNSGPTRRPVHDSEQPTMVTVDSDRRSITNSPKDQCIFIRYYKMKKRIVFPKIPMKAAAGPHLLPDGSSDTENGDSVSVLTLEDDPDFVKPSHCEAVSALFCDIHQGLTSPLT